MRSTTKILSAIVFSFSTAVLAVGCNAAPVAEIATEGAAAQESTALREVVVNDDSAIADDSATGDNEQGSGLAEAVGDAVQEPDQFNPIVRPPSSGLCERCRFGCQRRFSVCRLYPGGGSLDHNPSSVLFNCLRQLRLCMNRCRTICLG